MLVPREKSDFPEEGVPIHMRHHSQLAVHPNAHSLQPPPILKHYWLR